MTYLKSTKQMRNWKRKSLGPQCALKACWFFNPLGNSKQFRITGNGRPLWPFEIGVQYPFENKLIVGNCLH